MNCVGNFICFPTAKRIVKAGKHLTKLQHLFIADGVGLYEINHAAIHKRILHIASIELISPSQR